MTDLSAVRQPMTPSEIASGCLVYAALVGSQAYGLNLDEQADRDEMGIAIEPATHVIGLRHFESHVTRSQPAGVRSGPGDVERVVYSARKFAALAAKGNPTIVGMLYSPKFHTSYVGEHFVQTLKPLIASRAAGPHFLGYLIAQREKLTGERGGKAVKRPELEAAHGYDTKFAMHALRLGIQGCEFLDRGELALPMAEPQRSRLLDVRRGLVPFGDVIAWIRLVENDLRARLERSPLPPEPDHAAIDALLDDVYRLRWWGEQSDGRTWGDLMRRVNL
jgi:uncharacterized protein